jgi:hypothetical protein
MLNYENENSLAKSGCSDPLRGNKTVMHSKNERHTVQQPESDHYSAMIQALD